MDYLSKIIKDIYGDLFQLEEDKNICKVTGLFQSKYIVKAILSIAWDNKYIINSFIPATDKKITIEFKKYKED